MDVKQIRKENLRNLYEKYGGIAGVARSVETSESYLSQITSENGKRNVGAQLARKIEKLLSLPHGWMDQSHTVVNGTAAKVAIESSPGTVTATNAPKTGIDVTLDDSERKLINTFRQLPESGKFAVLTVLHREKERNQNSGNEQE